MTRQSFEAFQQVITVSWPRASLEQQRKLLIGTAIEGNQKIMAQQTARAGVRPSVEFFANTPGNTVLQSVKLPGPIVFQYDYRSEIAKVGLDLLRQASPVQSGRYRNAHVVLLNGQQIDAPPAVLRETDVLTLVNHVPYARRLEIGKTKSGRDFVLQVPNRIYERVAKTKLRPLYKNAADIEFNYIDLSGAYVTKGKLSPFYLTGDVRVRRSKLGAAGTLKRRLRRQKPGTTLRAPAIFIRPLRIKPV